MITIVVPTHNEADIIRDTLTRIRSGAGSIPHEIVVSDDGSNDATVATAEGHAEQVVQYAGELPKTIAANRNRGARAAHNDILMFLDSDTRLHDPAHFFDTVIRRFQENPTLVAMTGYARVYPEVETRADRIVLGYLNLQYRVMNLFGLGVTHGKCMIVRASTFREVGGFKEHIVASEDFELFTRLAKKRSTLVDPTLVFYFSARRARAMGWPRLLWLWFLNGMWVSLFGRSWSKEWTRADIEL